MDNYRESKVYVRNDLLISLHRLNYLPLKIFELIISKIDPTNPPKNNIVIIERKEITKFFEKNTIRKKYILKKNIQELQKESLFTVVEKHSGVTTTKSILPIPYVEWNDDESGIIFKLESEIMPYISDLQSNFTQYDLEEIRGLQSKYGIIFYRLLIMYYNQYVRYSKTKQKRQEQLDDLKNPIIPLDRIRFITDTQHKYKRFTNFDNNVLQVARKDINKNTKIFVDYEKIIINKEVTDIQFKISAKKIAPTSPENHPDFEEIEDLKDKNDSQIFSEVMDSKYTKMLMNIGFIEPETLFDQKMMINFGRQLYPYYEEVEEIRGQDGLQEHLRYVKTHQRPLSQSEINNGKEKAIVGYLTTSVKNFLSNIRTGKERKNNLELQMDYIRMQLENSYGDKDISKVVYDVVKEQVDKVDLEDDEQSIEDKQEQINEIESLLEELNIKKER